VSDRDRDRDKRTKRDREEEASRGNQMLLCFFMTVLWHAAHFMACRSFRRESSVMIFMTVLWRAARFLCPTILRNVLCFVLLCIQQKFSKEVLYGANGKPLYAFYGVNDGPGKLCVHSSIRTRMRAECMCVHAFFRVVLHAHTQLSRSPLPPSLSISLSHTHNLCLFRNHRQSTARLLHAACSK
jgi:hypothetical protein